MVPTSAKRISHRVWVWMRAKECKRSVTQQNLCSGSMQNPDQFRPNPLHCNIYQRLHSGPLVWRPNVSMSLMGCSLKHLMTDEVCKRMLKGSANRTKRSTFHTGIHNHSKLASGKNIWALRLPSIHPWTFGHSHDPSDPTAEPRHRVIEGDDMCRDPKRLTNRWWWSPWSYRPPHPPGHEAEGHQA